MSLPNYKELRKTESEYLKLKTCIRKLESAIDYAWGVGSIERDRIKRKISDCRDKQGILWDKLTTLNRQIEKPE